MPDLTVYWRPMCGYCNTLKSELSRRDIAYTDVNIWADRPQADVVREANGGDELVPTVKVGDQFLPNPSVEEVLEALGT